MSDCEIPLWGIFAATAVTALGMLVGLTPLWLVMLWVGRRDRRRWAEDRAYWERRRDEDRQRHEAWMRRLAEPRERGWE